MESNLFSRYRAELMGISIVLIVLFHCDILNFGDIGVDCFLFLSGLGLYRSLSKNSNKCSFYRKRFVRLLPAYLIVALPVVIIYDYNECWWKWLILAIGDFTTVSMLVRLPCRYWFFFVLIICYLLAPLFYSIICKGDKRKNVLVYVFILMVCTVITQMLPETSVWLGRIPIFFLGLVCCKYMDAEWSNCISFNLCICFLMLIFLFCILYYLANRLTCTQMRPIYQIVSPFLLYSISNVLDIKKQHYLNKILSFLGQITLEIYLVHQYIVLQCLDYLVLNTYIRLLLCLFISVIMAYAISKIVKIIEKRWLQQYTTVQTSKYNQHN